MDLPGEFFTVESITTFIGAVGATGVIANTFQRVFNFNPKWFALAVSVGICFFGTHLTQGELTIVNSVMAFINGCLVYLSAAGGTQAVGQPAGKELKTGKRRKKEEFGPTDGFSNTIGLIAAQESYEDYSYYDEKRKFLSKWF